MARWLDAKYYESKFKPIPIEEYLVCENAIYPAAAFNGSGRLRDDMEPLNPSADFQLPQACRIISPSEHGPLRSPLVNAVVALTSETVRLGYGVLVFCSSRMGCEQNAALLSEVMPALDQLDGTVREARLEVLSDLRNTTVGLDPSLEKTVPSGVAYHRKFQQSIPGLS